MACLRLSVRIDFIARPNALPETLGTYKEDRRPEPTEAEFRQGSAEFGRA